MRQSGQRGNSNIPPRCDAELLLPEELCARRHFGDFWPALRAGHGPAVGRNSVTGGMSGADLAGEKKTQDSHEWRSSGDTERPNPHTMVVPSSPPPRQFPMVAFFHRACFGRHQDRPRSSGGPQSLQLLRHGSTLRQSAKGQAALLVGDASDNLPHAPCDP